MYVLNLDIWIIGRDWRRKKIWTKTACLDMAAFFQIQTKKTQIFEIWKGFGGSLEHPTIWIFEQIDKLWQSPSQKYQVN